MSRMIDLLAHEAGMDPDEYLRSLNIQDDWDRTLPDDHGWGDAPPATTDKAEPPREPATKSQRHDRRRYDALNRRIQVREP